MTTLQLSDDKWFSGDVASGDGLGMIKGTGIVYRGQVRDCQMEGIGTMTIGNACYEGEFTNGAPGPRGKILWANGDSYIGEVGSGILPCGLGILNSNNGDTICGMFLEGKVHGHAKVYLSGGDTFTGQFRFGVRKGWGALTQVSSEEVEGFWSEGAFMYSCRDGDEISFAEAQQHASEACTDSLKLVDIIQMDIVRVAWQVKRQVVKLCFALEKESKVDMSAVQHLDEISETMSTATWHSEDIEGMLPQTSIPSGVAEEKPLKESDVSTRHIDESLERPTNIKSGIENEDTKMLLVDMQKNLLRSFGRSKSYLRPDTVEVADDNNPPTVILGSPRVHQIRGFIQQKFGVAEEPEISNNQILERRVRSSPADTSKLTAKQYALLWKALRPVTVQLNEGEEIPETSKYLWMKDNYDQNSSASSIFDPSPPSYPPPSVDGTISLAELDDVSIHPPNHPPASIDDGSPPCHSPSDENTDDEPDNINDGLSVISGVKPPLDEPSISSNLENSITNVIIENTSPMISPFAAPSPRFFGAHSGVFSISSNLSSPRRPVVLPPRPPLRPPYRQTGPHYLLVHPLLTHLIVIDRSYMVLIAI